MIGEMWVILQIFRNFECFVRATGFTFRLLHPQKEYSACDLDSYYIASTEFGTIGIHAHPPLDFLENSIP